MGVRSTVDIRLKFLYYYQIIEYSSYYYIDDDVRRNIQRILSYPDIQTTPNVYVQKILDAVLDIKQSNETKINKIVETKCSPEVISSELNKHAEYFSTRQQFDGGLTVEPLIIAETPIQPTTILCTTVTEQIRKIRNALAHAREKGGYVITPTLRNDKLLIPWTDVARRIAEHLIICSSVT